MKATFLEAKVPLTKTFTIVNGELKKEGHPKILDVLSHEEEFENLEQFAELLKKHGASGRCLLKGNLVRVLKWESRRNSTDPNEPTWIICLDVDGLKSVRTPMEFLRLVGLEAYDHVVQYSASMGVIPDKGLSCHIFVLLERPVAPPRLKQTLTEWNLGIPSLRSALGLTRTNNALRWPLDVSTCQSDKLIYIAPPLLGPGVKDSFEGERIEFVKGSQRALLMDKVPNAELNRVETQKALNVLRAAAGLPERAKTQFKSYAGVEYMTNPDKAFVTGRKDDGPYVHLNLNGGDSWGYWHPASNPEFIYNFKGEPTYKTSELLPDYWQEVKEQVNEPRKDEKGNMFLAFRDFRTATYYNGSWHESTSELKLAQARSEAQLRSFLKQHGQPVGDFIPDWHVGYDPHGGKVVDVEARTVNKYRPSEFEARYDAEKPKDPGCPPAVRDVLMHVVGEDREAYDHWLNWLACIVQFKTQTGTAWVWHGIQGTGKGLMLNKVLRPLIGMSNVVSKRMSELDSQFNGFLEGTLLLWLEEAEASAFRNASVMDANFKNYIVEPYVSIRHMFMAPYETRNYMNAIFSSNKDDPVILDPHDRRFSIGAFQAKKLIISTAGVQALEDAAWAMYCHMRAYPADRDKARLPLNNAAKRQMIHINRASVDVVCDALLTGDLQFFMDQRPTGEVSALPRFEQDAANQYVELLKKLEGEQNVTRDEIFTIVNYVVGGQTAAPAKFTAMLKHHRIHLQSVRRGSTVTRGIPVKWRKQ